jgi:peroxiredoxin
MHAMTPITVALCLLSGCGTAQEPAPSTPVPAPQKPAATPETPPPSPASVAGPAQVGPGIQQPTGAVDEVLQAAGMALLHQAMETFRQAPAITCTTHVQVDVTGHANEVTVRSSFGPEGSMRIDSPESTIAAVDGWLNIVEYRVYDRYLKTPVGEGVVQAIEGLYGDAALAGFEVMMREGQPVEAWLDLVLMRAVGSPKVTTLEEVQTDDGGTLTRIHLIGFRGVGTVDFDPERRTIVGSTAQMRIIPEAGAQPLVWRMRMKTTATFLDALPEPITFDPGAREGVFSRQDLDPIGRNALKIGQAHPPLVLYDMQGTLVDLSTLRGKSAVLVFWTSWSPPAGKSLKQLEALYQSLGDADGDVRIYAVNIMEQIADPADRVAQAKALWAAGNMTVPSLVAPGDEVQRLWGVQTVPLHVLIGPEGTVVEQWVGHRPTWDKDVRRSLEALSSDQAKPAQPE